MPTATFVPYAGFVSDVKKTYSNEYLKAQHAIGVNVRHYKEWDKADLLSLHDSYFGRAIFYHLVRLVTEARREEEARLASPSQRIYAFAQQDLADLAPEGMDWKAYAELITDTVASVRSISFRITQDLKKLFETDASEDYYTAYPEFDAQNALAGLDQVLVAETKEESDGQETKRQRA